jgi:putative FmdB family regulatory protein
MAIYEYRCNDCRAKFTVSQLISEHEERRKKRACPKCNGRNTRQIFSTFLAKTSSKS